MAVNDSKKTSRGQAFVAYVLKGIEQGHGFSAALGRADNPGTEYQSWEILAPWCDLEKDWERLPFATVGASLARARAAHDGTVLLGRAIAQAYSDEGTFNGRDNSSAKARLRRLLACKSAVEACHILRALLKLVSSRGVGVNHASLLDDLLRFHPDYTLPRWAQDFYGRKGEE